MPADMRVLDAEADDFELALEALLRYDDAHSSNIEDTVRTILDTVRSRGDQALVAYTNEFDRRTVGGAADLELRDFHLARERLEPDLLSALERAAARIRVYHEKQRMQSWEFQDPDGTSLGQQITPLERVGIYVPGGKAAYPSSVLMNAIPANVAGVGEIVMVVPAPDDQVEDAVLAAASIAGVDRIFTVGGAQAIAALAYGTDSVPAVDKIVGPGNIYVATAKSLVFGKVGIDMIAGPSEILVICDGATDPSWIAMDLFSQAEHDEQAQAILISPDAAFLERVSDAMNNLLRDLPRKEIVAKSLSSRGALIKVRDIDQAIAISNRVAPEHLELSVANARSYLPRVRHAGAVFLGRYTAEALGDYCAGPNHVLPTSGTARFSSPLGVYDFQKRTSIIECSVEGASTLGGIATVLAQAEGLTAHARSAHYRVEES